MSVSNLKCIVAWDCEGYEGSLEPLRLDSTSGREGMMSVSTLSLSRLTEQVEVDSETVTNTTSKFNSSDKKLNGDGDGELVPSNCNPIYKNTSNNLQVGLRIRYILI